MEKYFDKRMIASVVVAAVIVFFVQHYLTKHIVKDGKLSSYIGNDELGYTRI